MYRVNAGHDITCIAFCPNLLFSFVISPVIWKLGNTLPCKPEHIMSQVSVGNLCSNGSESDMMVNEEMFEQLAANVVRANCSWIIAEHG